MKTKKTTRAAVGVVIATLVSTCLIGGTFAKYVTKTALASDSARVAHWGFATTNSIDLSDLFSSSYTNVVGKENVIAPGTEGSVSFQFAYDDTEADAPEVAYEFAVSVEGECDATIKENPQIQFKLDNGQYGSFDDLIANLKLLSGDESGTKQYAAGELPTSFGKDNPTHTIAWKWGFTDAKSVDEQDAIDTAMGNAASLAKVAISLSITATQID